MLIFYKKSNGEIVGKSGIRKAAFVPEIEWSWNIEPCLDVHVPREDVDFVKINGFTDDAMKVHNGSHTAKVSLKTKKLINIKETEEHKQKMIEQKQKKERQDELKEKANNGNLNNNEIQEIIKDLI